MQKNTLRYILTWFSLALLLVCGTLLVISAWNSQIIGPPSPTTLVLLWIVTSASGIYLFMLAVKKAHRQWIDEKRHLELLAREDKRKLSRISGASRERNTLDFAASARKIVRRIPEDIALEDLGNLLLKSISHELEIMSGIFYLEKKDAFKAVSTFAMPASSEPCTFNAGEGLTGQAALNQQLMMITELPEGHLEVYSGLGKAAPSYLAIVPLVHKDKTIAVLECSGYRYVPGDIEKMFKILTRELMEKLAPHLF